MIQVDTNCPFRAECNEAKNLDDMIVGVLEILRFDQTSFEDSVRKMTLLVVLFP